MRRSSAVVWLAILGAACQSGAPGTDGASGRDPGVDGPRYGVGRSAPAALVAALDLDVGPDGAGLPPGRGTVADGERLYQAQCASCHGVAAEGMGTAFPALAGREPREGFPFGADPTLVRTIGNYWSHATTLIDYIRRAMPLTAPGSLSNDEIYAVSAYLLAMNDLLPKDGALDAAAVMAIQMPALGRFVLDDRRGGPTVK